jgi:hypothetical protein
VKYLFVSVLFLLTACVVTPDSAKNMSSAELCSEAAYDSNRSVAFAELENRGITLSNDEQCKIIYITKMQSFAGQQKAGAILLLGTQ